MAATASATITPSSSLQATAGGPGSRSRPDGKALKRALNDHDDLDHQALWRVRLGQAGERSLALRFLSVRLISEGAPGERRDGDLQATVSSRSASVSHGTGREAGAARSSPHERVGMRGTIGVQQTAAARGDEV